MLLEEKTFGNTVKEKMFDEDKINEGKNNMLIYLTHSPSE